MCQDNRDIKQICKVNYCTTTNTLLGTEKKMTSNSAPCDVHEYGTIPRDLALSSFQLGSLTATIYNRNVTGVFKGPWLWRTLWQFGYAPLVYCYVSTAEIYEGQFSFCLCSVVWNNALAVVNTGLVFFFLMNQTLKILRNEIFGNGWL